MFKKPVTTQWMTWGYVVDKSAAESILRKWPKNEFVCDDWKRMSKAVEYDAYNLLSCIRT
jgi:hypothetical protein